MKREKFFLIIFISLMMSCNVEYKSKIQGTWFYYNYNENSYNELSFFESKIYSSIQFLGPTEGLYKINKNSIILYSGNYEDTVKLRYKFVKDKVIIINGTHSDTLRKSISQVKESDYQTYSREKLYYFGDKLWERMKVNLKLLEND